MKTLSHFPPQASDYAQQYLNTSSPDGVLDPELQSTGLSALQPGEQAGQAPLPAVRLLLRVLLVHHGGPRDRIGLNSRRGRVYSLGRVKQHGAEDAAMLAGQQRALLLLLPPGPPPTSPRFKSQHLVN